MLNDLAVNKLILLYILSKTNIPIDSSELADFMIQNDYSDYFAAQQYFADLHKSDLIHKINQDKKTYYMITEGGAQTTDFFMNRIPKDYYDILDIFCLQVLNKYDDINLYDSKVSETSEGKYTISCFITKNDIEQFCMDLHDVPKDSSASVSKLWKDNGKEIFSYITRKMGL